MLTSVFPSISYCFSDQTSLIIHIASLILGISISFFSSSDFIHFLLTKERYLHFKLRIIL
jgi:hypothetical protein